jgi:hypothetical protein
LDSELAKLEFQEKSQSSNLPSFTQSKTSNKNSKSKNSIKADQYSASKNPASQLQNFEKQSVQKSKDSQINGTKNEENDDQPSTYEFGKNNTKNKFLSSQAHFFDGKGKAKVDKTQYKELFESKFTIAENPSQQESSRSNNVKQNMLSDNQDLENQSPSKNDGFRVSAVKYTPI